MCAASTTRVPASGYVTATVHGSRVCPHVMAMLIDDLVHAVYTVCTRAIPLYRYAHAAVMPRHYHLCVNLRVVSVPQKLIIVVVSTTLSQSAIAINSKALVFRRTLRLRVDHWVRQVF